MPTNTSPLETLAAFFIVFAAGALSAIGLRLYAEKIRRENR